MTKESNQRRISVAASGAVIVCAAATSAATEAGATGIRLDELDPSAYDVIVDGILGIGARGALRGGGDGAAGAPAGGSDGAGAADAVAAGSAGAAPDRVPCCLELMLVQPASDTIARPMTIELTVFMAVS